LVLVKRWAVLVALWPALASASTLELFGNGGRTPALAGVGVASSGDFDATYTNPAGLAAAPKIRVSFGGLYGNLELELDGQETDADKPVGTMFGAVVPLRLGGVLKNRVGLGLGVFVPTAALARARWPAPGQPTFALLDNRSQIVSLQGGLGARITPRLSVGLSVLALAGLGGGIHVSTDAGGRFISRSEQTLLVKMTPIVGGRYSLPEKNLELGVVLRGPSDATYDVTISNDVDKELPLTVPTLLIAGTAQYDPLTLAAEAAWRPRDDLMLAAQLAYQRWSAFPLPTGNPVEGTGDIEEPGFHDTVVPRLGAEWTVQAGATEFQFRGGYAFVMTPAPEMDGQQSLLDNHRQVGSMGVGVDWTGAGVPVFFDAWVQGHLLMSRTHEKDPDKFASPDDMPFERIETGGFLWVGGITLGVEL
jgi:long-subunit fatty acid transport protein